MSEEAFDPATSTRPIRLAISDVAELAFFSAVIDHFRRHAPQSQVRAVTLTEPQLRDALESGDADVAAGYYPALAAKSFRRDSEIRVVHVPTGEVVFHKPAEHPMGAGEDL